MEQGLKTRNAKKLFLPFYIVTKKLLTKRCCLMRQVKISFGMRVLFFAQLQDATGCDSVDLAITSPLSAEQLWTALLDKFPALAGHRANVRLSRNWEYAGSEVRFANSDEVALIPPVSGG